MMTADEWRELWEESGSEEEGDSYILPKIYPGPKIRCPNCGFWQARQSQTTLVSKIYIEAGLTGLPALFFGLLPYSSTRKYW